MPSSTFIKGLYFFLSATATFGFTQRWPPEVLLILVLLPMPCLILYFHVLTPYTWDKHKLMLLAILALSTLVDGILTFYGRLSQLYIISIILRMAGNLMFCYLFYREVRTLRLADTNQRWGVPRWVLIWAVSLAVLVMLAFWQGTASLRIVLLLYVTSMVLLTLAGINRIRAVLESSFQQVLIGIFLFIISNFVSAIDRFIAALPYPNALSFALYAGGFYLMVHGFWLQYRLKPLP